MRGSLESEQGVGGLILPDFGALITRESTPKDKIFALRCGYGKVNIRSFLDGGGQGGLLGNEAR
jgi:hypothetical protein